MALSFRHPVPLCRVRCLVIRLVIPPSSAGLMRPAIKMKMIAMGFIVIWADNRIEEAAGSATNLA